MSLKDLVEHAPTQGDGIHQLRAYHADIFCAPEARLPNWSEFRRELAWSHWSGSRGVTGAKTLSGTLDSLLLVLS